MSAAGSASGAGRPTIEVLATLGPASLSRRVITRLDEAGVSLFRINLSHTDLADLREIVLFVRAHTGVPLCLDSEGAQIRTGRLSSGSGVVELEAGARILLLDREAANVPPPREEIALPLVPDDIARELEPGDLLSLDFHGSLLQVLERGEAGTHARVLRGGQVGTNKAVSLQREIALPALSPKDRRAIEIGRELGIRHFALSFAGSADEVAAMRRLAGQGAFVISKIESRRALRELDGIARASDALLIDRGDLSREVEITRIPRLQRAVIARGRALDTPVYVATNLLESMLEAPSPTRAEVNDIYTTLRDGADGLVLAAETAIGRHPIACAQIVRKIAADDPRRAPDLGVLDAGAPDSPVARTARGVPRSRVTREVRVPAAVFDLALQIGAGLLRPLTGFMSEQERRCVRDGGRLLKGSEWPVEIALPRTADMLRTPRDRAGQVIAITAEGRDAGPAIVLDDAASPGDARISGEVVCLEGRTARAHPYELTPDEARAIFEAQGWTRVAGAVVSQIDRAALQAWATKQFESEAVDGILLALEGTEQSSERQAAALEALSAWSGRVVITGVARLPLDLPPEARRYLDAVRLRNLGCSRLASAFDLCTNAQQAGTSIPTSRSALSRRARAPIAPPAG